MRAVVMEPGGVAAILDVPQPRLAPGHVLVRVHAVSLAPHDVTEPERGVPATAEPGWLAVVGAEFSGVVVERAPDVTDHEVGDRVVGLLRTGALAEFVVATSTSVFRLPEGNTFEQGAIILLAGPSAVCLEAELVSRLGAAEAAGPTGPGEFAGLPLAGREIAITGAGGALGSILGPLLRHRGAQLIAASTSRDRDSLLSRGFAAVVDTTAEPVSVGIMRATEGRGAQALVDVTGRLGLDEVWRSLAQRGTYIRCNTRRTRPAAPDVALRRLQALDVSTLDFDLLQAIGPESDDIVTKVSSLMTGFSDGWLDVPIRTYPLDAIEEAVAVVRAGDQIGRTVVTL